MITFLKIHIKGFCSYVEEVTVDLNTHQTTLIKAPNGSGKSTIFSALTWALYGKSLKGKSEVNTWKQYQPKAYTGTLVEVFFQRDDSIYKVTRCQNYTEVLEDGAKGKDRLLLQKDAEVLSIKSKTQIQDKLNEAVGMTYKLFINSLMFGQGIKRLVEESNADKKKLFEEAFNLNFINLAKGIATEEKNKVHNEVRDFESQLESLQKELTTTHEAFKDLWEREKNFQDTLSKEKKRLKKERTRLTQELIKIKKTYSEDKENLVALKIKRVKKSLEEVRNGLATAKKVSNIPLLDLIEDVIKLLKKGKVKKALESMLKIRKAFKDIDRLQDEREELQDTLSTLQDKQRSLDKSRREADELSDEIAEVDEKIRNLKTEKLKVVSPKYKKKQDKIKEEIKAVRRRLNKYQEKLDDYEWLLNDPLSNKGIKAFLFDSSLDLLNHTLDSYASVLGFRISFEVDLGSTKKDFVTLIERDGIIIDYDDLSGGERQLCNVAMAFAMNESMTASKGINIAFLDEVFESLDAENIELVISLINTVYEDKSLFLITHHESLPLSNVKTMQVVKAHGRSTIKLL